MGFAEWTRGEYNRIIVELKTMDINTLKTMLLADGDDLDPSVRNFVETLWQDYSADFKFDGGLAALQGRYIMHTVCPYLEQHGQKMDEKLQHDLSHLIWQYFGQSAGYVIAAAYLSPNVSDNRIVATVETFSKGV